MKFVGNTTQPSNPLWNEYYDEEKGTSTLREYQPRKISSFDTCKHFFKMIDETNAQCSFCGLGQKIVWGIQFVKKGKIIKSKNAP